jgi:hypothetical protein
VAWSSVRRRRRRIAGDSCGATWTQPRERCGLDGWIGLVDGCILGRLLRGQQERGLDNDDEGTGDRDPARGVEGLSSHTVTSRVLSGYRPRRGRIGSQMRTHNPIHCLTCDEN